MLLVLFVRPDPKTIAQNLARYLPGLPRSGRRWRVRPTAACASGYFFRRSRTAFANSFAAQGVMTMMMAMTSLALDHHGYGLLVNLGRGVAHVVGMFGFSIPLGRLVDRSGAAT